MEVCNCLATKPIATPCSYRTSASKKLPGTMFANCAKLLGLQTSSFAEFRGKNWVAAARKPLEDTPCISASIHAETPRVTRKYRCSKCVALLPCKSTGARRARLAHQEFQSSSGLSRLVARRLPMQSTSDASPQSLLTRLLCPLCALRSFLGGGNAAEKQFDREAAACLSVSVTCLAKSRLYEVLHAADAAKASVIALQGTRRAKRLLWASKLARQFGWLSDFSARPLLRRAHRVRQGGCALLWRSVDLPPAQQHRVFGCVFSRISLFSEHPGI